MALDCAVTMLAEKTLRVIREKVELLHAACFRFGLYSGEEVPAALGLLTSA